MAIKRKEGAEKRFLPMFPTDLWTLLQPGDLSVGLLAMIPNVLKYKFSYRKYFTLLFTYPQIKRQIANTEASYAHLPASYIIGLTSE